MRSPICVGALDKDVEGLLTYDSDLLDDQSFTKRTLSENNLKFIVVLIKYYLHVCQHVSKLSHLQSETNIGNIAKLVFQK